MIIGIDITIASYGRGVANYIIKLLENFLKISPENEYRAFYNSFRSQAICFDTKRMKVVTTRIPQRILKFMWLDLGFPKIESFLGLIDLFHSPAHSPVYAICPPANNWIVTVHDLFTFKLNYPKRTRQEEWKILLRMAKKAAHVIAVSESTKKDLLELIPSLESRVSVIHEGVDEIFQYNPNHQLILNKYNIDTPYILYVGSAGPNKNLLTLIEAFSQINKLTNHNLVLVGDVEWRYKPLMDMVKKKRLQKRVQFTGFVPKGDLPAIYSGADVFVCPSLYEGFGLTVLEAMACKTPVVASNISSIPEIVNDSAILFDPYSVDDLNHSLLQILGSETLRDELRAKGSQRVKKFSWTRAAKQTLELYKNLAN